MTIKTAWFTILNIYLKHIILASFLFVSFCVEQINAASYSGTLLNVTEGDVVIVLYNDNAERVRLARIDAPYVEQPYGKAAIRYVMDVALNKTVTVTYDSFDMYGLQIGEVTFPDGQSLNKLVVGAGYAWQLENQGSESDSDYAAFEESAKSARLGLWRSFNPIPPWEWQWVQRQLDKLGESFNCSDKKYCHEMSDCDEAKLYMYACGNRKLDKEQNGVACSYKCR